MKVSNIQNNNLYCANSVSFKAATNFDRILPSNKGIISKKSVKLINELNSCIDKEWKDIKQGKKIAEKPIFQILDGKKHVTFEPVYAQKYPALLIDINDGKYNERILMNRDNPNNFRYEKMIKTDHGSATLKTYSSINGGNSEIDKFVNNIVENNLEKILSNKMWDRILNRIEEGID